LAGAWEATTAAAFAVEHLLGKSLDSHLVVICRLHDAKIVELWKKIVVVTPLGSRFPQCTT
jgi:hypothetical protein